MKKRKYHEIDRESRLIVEGKLFMVNFTFEAACMMHNILNITFYCYIVQLLLLFCSGLCG